MTIIITAISAAVAASVGLTQLVKWMQEFGERRRNTRDALTRAEVERDSIAIKGAEGVLAMMQEILKTAQASERELQKEVAELRKRIKALEERNDWLEQQLRRVGFSE